MQLSSHSFNVYTRENINIAKITKFNILPQSKPWPSVVLALSAVLCTHIQASIADYKPYWPMSFWLISGWSM